MSDTRTSGDGGLRRGHVLIARALWRLFAAGLRPEVNGSPALSEGGVMAKRHCRPSAQYRYEHYDPKLW
jgi:hypothetical protein